MTFRKTSLLILFCLSLVAAGCSAKQKTDPGQTPGVIRTNMANVAALAVRQGDKPVVPTIRGKENVSYCTLAMVKPADGPINSAVGVRQDPGKRSKKFHKGIDIGAKRGADVTAAAAGKVVFAGRKTGYGNTVEIEHGSGMTTRYAHLGSILVSEGQAVDQSSRIGLVGSSGHATGANLHFELLAQGRPVNPIPQSGWQDASTALASTDIAPQRHVAIYVPQPAWRDERASRRHS